VISLQQPAPEVFDLFDDIVLLVEGHIVYNGPRESVMMHFNSLGFSKPADADVADFLQEVALPEGLNYLAGKQPDSDETAFPPVLPQME
jgi:ABC-type multidrug transport system ATPase subunit